MERKTSDVLETHERAAEQTIDLRGRVSIYQPEQEGLIFPQLPAFSSHAEHRRHLEERLVAAFTGVKAAIHQNHGLLTASRHSIDSAAFWFIALERCCQQQLMIEATGTTPKLVPEDRARYSREHVGSDYIGWLHFQTIWNDFVATQPDRFD